MRATDERTLHVPSRLRFELGVAEERTAGHARVRVTVVGNGAQRIYPGSRLTVNGRSLVEKPLSKQGVWYTAQVPLASAYNFDFVLSDGQPVFAYRQVARSFDTQIPPVLSRGQGVRFPFAIGPMSTGDDIEIEIEIRPARQIGDKRALRFKPIIEQDQLIVSARQLGQLPLGPAKFVVGMYAGSERHGAIDVRFAVLHRADVSIKN